MILRRLHDEEANSAEANRAAKDARGASDAIAASVTSAASVAILPLSETVDQIICLVFSQSDLR